MARREEMEKEEVELATYFTVKNGTKPLRSIKLAFTERKVKSRTVTHHDANNQVAAVESYS